MYKRKSFDFGNQDDILHEFFYELERCTNALNAVNAYWPSRFQSTLPYVKDLIMNKKDAASNALAQIVFLIELGEMLNKATAEAKIEGKNLNKELRQVQKFLPYEELATAFLLYKQITKQA